jgi:hypothetical protein
MRGELAVDFERPPIRGVPFPIGRVEGLGLLRPRAQEGAVAEGIDLHVALAVEAEPVATAGVVKRVVGEFKLLRARTKGRDGRSKVQVGHRMLLS